MAVASHKEVREQWKPYMSIWEYYWCPYISKSKNNDNKTRDKIKIWDI